ncbi:hypothetical protein ABW19_dt0204723 [Dactylella cylindrospora]|nr:hypothetical protein ABW19_dt0204723 [Dactylella cylindrospora]
MQHITTLSLSLLLLGILQGATSQEPRACYFPNGRVAEGYVACEDNATGHSACCQNSNQTTCFATGLCYLDSGFYERGACTDQAWRSDACPGPCRDFENSGQNILACSDSSSSFCCATGGDPSCCQDDTKYFTFDIGQIAFINGSPVSRTRSPTTSSTQPPTTTSTTPPSSTAEPEIIEKTLTGALAGMGAGIAVASVTAVVFAFLYFRERRKSKKRGGMLYSENDSGHDGSPSTQMHNVQGHSQFAGLGIGGDHDGRDAGEREGFMSGRWGNNNDAHGLAPIPPKYVPPERRAEVLAQNQVQQQVRSPQELQQPREPVGELPTENNRLEGLSELGGSEGPYR